MPASQSIIYPDAVTKVWADAESPVTISVGNDTLSYGTTTALGSSLSAGQSHTFYSTVYIKTTADSAVSLRYYDPWDPPASTSVTDAELQALEAAYINVKDPDYGATGDGVTNDRTAIQNAIDALPAGGRIYFPPGAYKISTALDLTDTQGITLEGAAGMVDTVGNILGLERAPTYLLYSGTGTASAIDCSGSVGFTMRNLGAYYSSGSFSGRLIDLDDSCSQALIDNCDLGSLDGALTSAKCCVSLYNDWINTVNRCNLRGAEYGILGDRLGASFSNAHRITNNGFYANSVAHIAGMSENWVIDSNIFEMGSEGDLVSTPAVLATPTTLTGALTSRFTFSNNWVGDFDAGATDPAFAQGDASGDNYWHADFHGNFIASTHGPIFDLQSGGQIYIVGNPFIGHNTAAEPIFDLGDSTPVKRAVVIARNTLGTTTADPVTGKDGVEELHIHSNGSESTALGMRTVIGHERIGWPSSGAVPRPTIAAEAALGGGSPIAAIAGSDTAGYVFLHPGTSPAAGTVCTITLGTELTSYAGGVDALHVILTPVQGFSGSGDEGVACGASVVAAAANTATWGIRVKTAIGGDCAFFYRVLGI
jgi:hypothetical protein